MDFYSYPDVGHAFMTGFTAEGIANMETIGCPVRVQSKLSLTGLQRPHAIALHHGPYQVHR